MIIILGGFLLLIMVQMLDPEMPRVLRWGVPSMLVVAGAVFAERARPFSPMALFTFFGNASYSIYVWHVLVVVVVTGIILRLGVPPGWQPASVAFVSIAISAALYLIVEKPLTGLLKPLTRQSPQQVKP